MTDVFDSLAPGTVAHTMLYDAACAARRHEDGPALTHSWLFTGPPGAGRSTAALAFAASLVCTNDESWGVGTAMRAGPHWGEATRMSPMSCPKNSRCVSPKCVIL
nr:hypothetical protein [Corynebacterium argentoratense]